MLNLKTFFKSVNLVRMIVIISLLSVIVQFKNVFSDRDAAQNFSFEIRDGASGELIPGKLVFLRNGLPVNLKVKSRGLMASRGNTIYTADGKGMVHIPSGNYEVWAGRGMEYSADVQQIRVAQRDTLMFTAQIRREVETPGYIGADLHLHTLTFSGHGDTDVDERIISCIGEGLEWAIATDHNHTTDYTPNAQKLGVAEQLAITTGNEISTPNGHFNAYPLPKGSESGLDHEDKNAQYLFHTVRSISPEAVIQVNHPREKARDYFNSKNLDPRSATTDDPTWSWDFDAIEVLNENRGQGWSTEPNGMLSAKSDWFQMLNNDRKFSAVGNSDSHHVTELLAGVPRNYIASATDDVALLDEAELLRNIKNHNLSVSRGLYIELHANENSEIGSEIFATDGKVALHIRVQAAGWVSCDTVKVIGNGQVVRAFPVPSSKNPVRFEQIVTLFPMQDTWYLVIATGSRSMAPLVHDASPKRSIGETEDIHITPLAFTNPIWVKLGSQVTVASL